MELVKDSGGFYLDEKGERVRLTNREMNLFRQMNPMGRRLTLRKRATDRAVSSPEDPEIKLIMKLTQLPARDWGFIVPD